MIKNIKDTNTQNADFEKMGILEGKYEKIIDGYKSISANKKNFVINEPVADRNGEFRSISIQPLYISSYVNHYFQNPCQIFMSATIDKESFCENLGWPQEDVAFIDSPKSPFKLENRSISFENTVKLNYKSTENERFAAIKRIDEILSAHKNHRGLILTSSKSRCFAIQDNLSPENRQRITIWHSTGASKKTIEQALKDHESKSNSVLLSSSLWEGVDLKDDLSRFQIIEKTPYADLTDKRVSIKMKVAPTWYQSLALMKLLQGFGRSVRSDTDWAKTYVIDSAAQELLNRLHSRVPKAYHDVFGWN
jgi:Rad3-related DNA helicase